MEKKLLSIALVCAAQIFFAQFSLAQFIIKGKVVEGLNETALQGATVIIKGTETTAITDTEGYFSVESPEKEGYLVVSFVGYDKETVKFGSGSENLLITMMPSLEALMDVVIVGSRFDPRSNMTSLVPIDNITSIELNTMPNVSLDHQLTYLAPSFNASNQAISDATAHVDPADLRGLMPSRTLVLINGKRKNASALLYLNDTPGKGEVGTDFRSIPTAAIERVEILRDGASAQYGSDAIAGVINIVLKNNVNYGEITSKAGITTKGDGAVLQTDLHYGFGIGNDTRLSVTASFLTQGHTNRPGDFTGKDSQIGLIDADEDLLKRFPNGGMTVGQPDMQVNNVAYNFTTKVGDKSEFYSFGSLMIRNGRSFALYRLPTWQRLFADPLQIMGTNGFQPDFRAQIEDKFVTTGFKTEKNGWYLDISTTYGSNSLDQIVGNTVNPSLGLQTPTEFYAGSQIFSQIVNTADVSKKFGKINFAFGGEFRRENFRTLAGEEASYFGRGANSFPGLRPENEVNKNRYNAAAYAELEFNPNEEFSLSGALRHENYSDFGDRLNGKIAARYLLFDKKLNIRGAFSTGFRAPALHQIYYSNVQTIIINGRLTEQGTFSNISPIIRALEVPRLKAETSVNISFGLAYQPKENLTFSLDAYQISVKDRIVFTGNISNRDTTTNVGRILNRFEINGLKFFTNAIDTRTQGADFVMNYKNIELGTGKAEVTLSANFNKTEIIGDLRTPDILRSEGNTLFDRKERSRIETARPQSKMILSLRYTLNKWSFVLQNTRFGSVTWRHQSDPENDQTFRAKVVTDLFIQYDLNKSWSFFANAANLLNVYPDPVDPKNDPSTNLIGRFKYPWEVNQFGFAGTYLYAGARMKF
jgi:iron complex outermembrane receptor protein